MTPFEEWATEYFGPNVPVPEACRDAWNAAVLAEREACRLIAQQQNTKYGDEIAALISTRDSK